MDSLLFLSQSRFVDDGCLASFFFFHRYLCKSGCLDTKWVFFFVFSLLASVLASLATVFVFVERTFPWTPFPEACQRCLNRTRAEHEGQFGTVTQCDAKHHSRLGRVTGSSASNTARRVGEQSSAKCCKDALSNDNRRLSGRLIPADPSASRSPSLRNHDLIHGSGGAAGKKGSGLTTVRGAAASPPDRPPERSAPRSGNISAATHVGSGPPQRKKKPHVSSDSVTQTSDALKACPLCQTAFADR